MLQLLSEPAWQKFIARHEVDTVPAALAYLEERIFPAYEQGMGFWVVEDKATQQPIGICGIVKRPYLEEPDLGFAFLEMAWGTGVAAESARSVIEFAEQELALETLGAITVKENVQSIRLLEKLGFSFNREIMNPDHELLALYSLSLGDRQLEIK